MEECTEEPGHEKGSYNKHIYYNCLSLLLLVAFITTTTTSTSILLLAFRTTTDVSGSFVMTNWAK